MTAGLRRWRAVTFGVAPLAADAAAGWLFLRLETGLATELREGRAELTFFMESGELDVPLLAEELSGFLAAIDAPAEVVVARDEWVEEQNWAEMWRLHAQPIRVGRRLLILPSGHEPSEEGLVVVRLDPGLAFGSGSHISTRLALELLEGHVTAGARVLDVGCGSGILSVAASLLGAGSVDAIDTDPQAVEAATRNAERNGRSDRVRVRLGDGIPPGSDHAYDVVVANITPPVLARMLPDVARALRPGGVFVGSGILAERLGEVVAPLEANADLALLTVEEQEGWCGIACARRPT